MNRPSTWVVRLLAIELVIGIGGGKPLSAQVPVPADSLRQALLSLTARLDSLEQGQCPGARSLTIPGAAGDSVAAALRDLDARLNRLIAARCGGGAPAAAAPVDTSQAGALAALRAAAAAAAGGPAPSPSPTDTTRPAAPPPIQFVGKQRNASALNPEISATGDVRLVAHDAGVQRSNGVAREFEVGFQSALDPYSNTKVFLSFEQDEIGVEEGYVYWTGLPGRIRVDVGKFRQEVGDLNRWHLHALPETEYPLVYQRFLGPEGLDGIGLSLYTALPLSLAHGTHELWLQGTTAESDPLTAGSHQPTGLGRLQNFWQLSRSTYVQLGFSGAGSANHDSTLTSRVLGADFRLTWRPPSAGTRQDLTIRAEGYQFHSHVPGTTTTRYGGFADLQYRASQRWVLGVRWDRVETPRGPDLTESRLTPAITWWESEFVFLRLQGEHAWADDGTDSNQLTLQVVWAMGPHKHETY
jgi:hypothetical protein